MAGCNVEGSAADRAMQGGETPLHVQRIASQQQLVQDVVIAMAGRQVARGHALVIVAGHVAASNDQLGHHLQVTPFSCMVQCCSKQVHVSLCSKVHGSMLQQAGMCQCVQYDAQLYGAMLQQAGLCQPVQYHAELCSFSV